MRTLPQGPHWSCRHREPIDSPSAAPLWAMREYVPMLDPDHLRALYRVTRAKAPLPTLAERGPVHTPQALTCYPGLYRSAYPAR